MSDKDDLINRCDDVLYMDDPDFVSRFMDAIGVKPGDSVKITTPQFDRTDGKSPVLSIDDWERLRGLSKETLSEMGCCPWDEPDSDGKTLMLFPHEWYEQIPDGFLVQDINGEFQIFKRGETDDDRRFGVLAYGIRAS